MSPRFHSLCLSVGLATGVAGVAIADPPAGNPITVEAAGITESLEASAATTGATAPESPGHAGTRAQRLAEIEATDPMAWLMRFGSVEKRPLLHAEP